MKRDVYGQVIFEEDEERLLSLLYNTGVRTRQARLNNSAFQEMSGLDFTVIEHITGEFLKNNIITSNEKTGAFQLTHYGRNCATYVINKPKLVEKQAQFLKELFTRSKREKTDEREPAGTSFTAVDRYDTGRSVGCNPVEVDTICAALCADNLIECELKEVKIFQDTEFERIRKIPSKRVKITRPGIEKIQAQNLESHVPKNAPGVNERSESAWHLLKPASKAGLPQEISAGTLNPDVDQTIDNISDIIKVIALAALTISLILIVAFY